MPTNADLRATPRIPAKIAIAVEGRDMHHRPFSEESHTLLVNDGGALIPLGVELQLQDHIRITNKANGNAADCRIAWRSANPIQGRWSYGIALLGAVENFWALEGQS